LRGWWYILKRMYGLSVQLQDLSFSVKNMNLNRNMYTVSRIIPPINKEAFHYETADYRIFRTFRPFFVA
jgi:hypothetical protein